VKRKGVSTGSVETLVSGRPFPTRIAVDSSGVYWTESNGGNVMKCALAGGSATTLASGLSSPWSVAVDANSVYWSEYAPNGRVMKIAKVGTDWKRLHQA